MAHTGFATIDFETTGLFPGGHDRAIELAVVHSDPDGTITGRWDTLINPGRDLGRQDIHRISAAEILRAPTFAQIAPELIERLDRRVIVAHNASFDTRFLIAELERLDYTPDVELVAMCTMQLARVFLPGAGRSLADCCAAFDISLDGAHRASVDAHATARLLAGYIDNAEDRSAWDDALEQADRARLIRYTGPSVPWFPREHAQSADRHFLERMVEVLPPFGGTDAENEYLALLDRCLLDRVISQHESDGLVTMATELGITRASCENLHLEYFWSLGAAAWSDGVLTRNERADLETVAALLHISADQVSRVLATPDQRPNAPDRLDASLPSFRLEPGDLITLTGEMRRPRAEWHELLEQRGFIPKDAVTKKVKLVVAADPDSLSGKARKARDYGITVVDEAGLARLLSV
ncbi:DNA polymerase III subunit epsilon [Plantibacter flavus]|uniref:exonuclease domain-containing protein n=1 Tax=Plantibacter flavus TaxID=150123 RepID=UPI003F15113D